MKKLIAISVMLALITGAVFADIGGGFRVKWNVFEGSNAKGDKPETSLVDDDDMTVNFGGGSEDGKISFNFRIAAYGNYAHHWVKWQIIDVLKIYAGHEDGWFGFDPIVGWGFHQGGNDGASMYGYSYGAGGNPGIQDAIGFEITPMDGLAIRLGLDNIGVKGTPGGYAWEDAFDYFLAAVNYNLDGIGTFNLAYKTSGVKDNNGNLGFGFDGNFGDLNVAAMANISLVKDNTTMGVSLGAVYDAGDFGVKFRASMDGLLADNYKFGMNANLMPFYRFDFGTAYLNFGAHIAAAKLDFMYINPYIVIPVGGPELMIALQLDNLGAKGKDIEYKLPIVLKMGF